MIKKINLIFITFFYVGKIKFAPGTFASLLTCLIFFILSGVLSIVILFSATLLIFLYSLVAINNSFDLFNSQDPQEIVIDEVVGQMLPLLAIPIYETLYPISKAYYCFVAFLLFRLFDIWKPFPINYIDKNSTGAKGIMLDDILAGIFSFFTLFFLCFLLGG